MCINFADAPPTPDWRVYEACLSAAQEPPLAAGPLFFAAAAPAAPVALTIPVPSLASLSANAAARSIDCFLVDPYHPCPTDSLALRRAPNANRHGAAHAIIHCPSTAIH